MPDTPSNRREFFRLRYPEADRPWLKFKKLELPVAELSEEGVRVVVDDITLSRNERVAADVRFADGAIFGVVGTVIRHEDGEAVLKLDMGVPLKRMLSEQKWIFSRYPMWPNGNTPPAAD